MSKKNITLGRCQRRLLRGGQHVIMAGTEQMKCHQTHGNHVFDTILLQPLVRCVCYSVPQLAARGLFYLAPQVVWKNIYIDKVFKNYLLLDRDCKNTRKSAPCDFNLRNLFKYSTHKRHVDRIQISKV
jgi:hypothetical protein